MEPALKRATIYLDSQLHKALKLKSIETSKSISALVSQAVKDSLAEDATDIEAFEERTKESVLSFAEMVARLKADGRI
ncbi:CopG family transcriptional regulator [Desulfobulbus rhabdoformis]|uniref:CopG family transcriptional regulator n=1 Tax=Desulfobulbus rhabdoformis TaxID=34032 RepID=UPI001964EFD0|nr:CopG family transcriptional regulator [Desulfobulbus rhabdoformis]MBM9616076.1 CopG family transcriptional regulator [Desulfobulbus rhabdoformis]